MPEDPYESGEFDSGANADASPTAAEAVAAEPMSDGSTAENWDTAETEVIEHEDLPAGGHPLAATEPARARRALRLRVIDWAIGAGAMLVLLVLSLVLLWLSITRPAGTSAAPTPPPHPVVPSVTPPADLDEDSVWLGDINFEAGSLVAAGTPLLDVVAIGENITSGPDGLIADHLDLTGTVPFDVVAAEIGEGTVVSPAPDGQASVARTVEILGRDLDVEATGTVTVVNGILVMEPTSIDIGGTGFFSDILADMVREFVTIEHEIVGLPDGLVLQNVKVTDDGFRASLEGWDISLVS